MNINPFNFFTNSGVIYGSGKIRELYTIAAPYRRILLIYGHSSFKQSRQYIELVKNLSLKTAFFELSVKTEPSPKLINDAVDKFKDKSLDLIIAVGGGSVLDTGKAVSAMLKADGSVEDYLEGIGTKKHSGGKVPFIGVPTTAGTGSEGTKNAVISKVGIDGFKKSLRHNNFFPDIALLDPELTLTCPFSITARCGMDAFSQLLESYVSTKASILTDTLALSGLKLFGESFMKICGEEPDNIRYRGMLSYASYLSGVCLANAGLGAVHGIAGAAGGFSGIPHGLICGILLGDVVEVTIKKLEREKPDDIALEKFARVGDLLSRKTSSSSEAGCEKLISTLKKWTDHLEFPPLTDYGITMDLIEKIADNSSSKNNPVSLDKKEIREILAGKLNKTTEKPVQK